MYLYVIDMLNNLIRILDLYLLLPVAITVSIHVQEIKVAGLLNTGDSYDYCSFKTPDHKVIGMIIVMYLQDS